MTPSDLTRAARLRIRTQIDLRRPDEVRNCGRGPFETLGSRYAALSVLPDSSYEQLNRETGTLGEWYLAHFQYPTTPRHRVFEVLADDTRYPAPLRCTAGKDRTGVITALLLSFLTVDRATWKSSRADRVSPEGISREAFRRSAGVGEDPICVFLDGLEEPHGEPLRNLGVDNAMQDAIPENLLEDARRLLVSALVLAAHVTMKRSHLQSLRGSPTTALTFLQHR